MTSSSLVPEQQLVFSPGLAATIGLEEAILLQHLHALLQHLPAQPRGGRAWASVPRRQLLEALPFWSDDDLARLCRRLVDLGVLLVEERAGDASLTFALDGGRPAPAARTRPRHAATPATAEPAPPPPRQGARSLPAGWRPGNEMLELLTLNHNIPRAFALEQLEDFVLYWRERGEASHAWENKFRQHVLSAWRRHQQDAAEAFRQQPAPLDGNWRPHEDALEILLRAGVARDFIDDSIPEFVLYWRERGSAPKELSSRFVQHIRMQWARYQSSRSHSTEPQRIPKDWQPGEDVFEILALSYIDANFARSLVPEFVLYWRDSNQLHTSWNSKFLKHVKYEWARHNQLATQESGHGGQQGAGGTGRTRDRSLEQDLRDTSWAD